jgi:hypothetical protein
VRYGAAHDTPPHLVGVALVPVQALESAGVLAIAAVGAALVLGGADPGAALAWYGSAYAVLRFALELLRGDAARPYVAGLSAAQWISLAIAAAVAIVHHAYAPAAAVLAVAAVLLMITAPRRRLLGPRHVAELAAALDRPGVCETSLGVRVSSGMTDGRAHYTLSGPGAQRMATLVARLRGGDGRAELLRGPTGAVHVVIPVG